MHNRGFTLLELMLAMAIFAIVGFASSALLDAVMRGDEASQQAQQRLQKLQQSFMLMERDFWQITPRQIRLNGEAPSKAVFSGGKNWIESDDDGVTFSHAGWSNPGAVLPRSEVQLVGYRLKEKQLQRLYYIYPDAITGTEPRVQVLMDKVEGLKVRYMEAGRDGSARGSSNDFDSGADFSTSDFSTDSSSSSTSRDDDNNDEDGNWLDTWEDSRLPALVKVTIVHEQLGEIDRVFTMPPGLTQ